MIVQSKSPSLSCIAFDWNFREFLAIGNKTFSSLKRDSIRMYSSNRMRNQRIFWFQSIDLDSGREKCLGSQVHICCRVHILSRLNFAYPVHLCYLVHLSYTVCNSVQVSCEVQLSCKLYAWRGIKVLEEYFLKQIYYRKKKFLYIGFKRLSNLKYSFYN